MSGLTTGVGLISGIDTATLIEQLLILDSQPKFNLQLRLAELQSQQTALLDINARLLNLKTTSSGLRTNNVFQSILATSTNESLLKATPILGAPVTQTGTFNFTVKQLVSTSQKMTGSGFVDPNVTPAGLTQLNFEIGSGFVTRDDDLSDLNGGTGVQRGEIAITTNLTETTIVDLSTATTVNEVLDAINTSGANVTATVEGDRFVLTENDGDEVSVAEVGGRTTGADLGLVGAADDGLDGVLDGDDVRTVSGATALSSLNDGTGVTIVDTNDLVITDRNGGVYNINLGRFDNDITPATLLEDLNDGAGITVNSDSTEDIKFTSRDGDEHLVDLTGAVTVQDFFDRVFDQTDGDISISMAATDDRFTVTDNTGMTVSDLKVEGAGPNGAETANDLGIFQAGIGAPTFDGTAIPNADHTPRAATLQEVIDRINNADGNTGEIVASIGADNASLRITDTTGGLNNLIVTSTSSAAADLGIETTPFGVQSAAVGGDRFIAGLNSVLLDRLDGGSGVGAFGPELTGETLISDLLVGAGIDTTGDAAIDLRFRDRANNPWVEVDLDSMTTVQEFIDFVGTTSGGNLTLTIDGNALTIRDHTGSTAFDLRARDRNGTTAATDLGLEGSHAADQQTGIDLRPVATRSFDITDRTGAMASINLVDAKSLSDVISAINNAGIGVVASANDAGNGLVITDTTGSTASNLVIADTQGTLATELGIAGDVAADFIRGGDLDHQYVTESTSLDDLNFGNGISTGSFIILDGEGDSATVQIDASVENVHELLDEINTAIGLTSVDATAQINATGDGIELVNTAGSGIISVSDVNGTAAEDLRLAGSATVDGGSIDGSYETTITFSPTDTLNEIASKVNDAGIPVRATVLNTGAGPAPYQLVFASEITGAAGELLVDDLGAGLGLTTLSEGRDAKVFFGNPDPADAVLIKRSSNVLNDVIQGVTLDLESAGDESVTVQVDRDLGGIEQSVADFAAAFNDAIGVIDSYDFFNTETEEAGVLLGNSTTSQIRNALLRAVQAPVTGVTTQFTRLSQVGVQVGANSQVVFDRDKFRDALDEDFNAVVNLFTAFQGSTQTSEEIEPGVTVTTSNQTFSQLGVADVFDQLLDGLANSVDGTLALADEGLDSQIGLIEDRIDDFDDRLAVRRQLLERQFAAMEVALAELTSQQSALLSLTANLSLSLGLGG